MKTLIKIFQNLVVIIALLLILFLLIPTIIGIKPYVVLSGSMEPIIKTGSIVYINTYKKAEDVQENDIISFKIDNGQVVHRVISINDDETFTTKGDANNTVDSNSVSFNDYIGETMFSIPYLGFLLSSMKSKTGILIIFFIVFLNIGFVLFDKKE